MSLNNMKARLNYMGGASQVERMNKAKLNSLKKALLSSYQAATVQLSDGREFRCLINPNKLSSDLDNKIISIPFQGVCLNSSIINDNVIDNETTNNFENMIATLSLEDENYNNQENLQSTRVNLQGQEVDINIKEGDVVCWKENGSHWIVYLRRLEETAYFRADIRRCRHQLTLGNGLKYWAYVRGPVEQSILWSQVNGNYFNKLNYSLIMYIQRNKDTLEYFHRFKKIMINDKPWEVQAVDSISTPGIIEVSLKETFSNSIEENIEKVVEDILKEPEIPEQDHNIPYIYGLDTVYPYDVCKYEIKNYNEQASGVWVIKNTSRKNMVKISALTKNGVELSIITGKSGSFSLCYEVNGIEIASLDIKIGSL